MGKTMLPLLAVILVVALVYGYVKAFRKVKEGRITVYKDWRDFGWSVAWLFCLIGGFLFWVLGSVSHGWQAVFYMLAVVCGVIGCRSLVRLIRGAFLFNEDRKDAWLSLLARFLGAIFTVGIVGLIWQEDGSGSRRKPNLFMELLWVLIYCWLFKTCLMPLIKDNKLPIKTNSRREGVAYSEEFMAMCENFQEGEDGLLEFLEVAGEDRGEEPDEEDVDEIEECFDEVAKPGVERMRSAISEHAHASFAGEEKELYELFVTYVKISEEYLDCFDKFMLAGDGDTKEEAALDRAAENLGKVMDKLREMGWRE